jgi:BTB/POZ domain
MHEYALHWDNFHDSLSSGFLNIYREQVGVDVTLVCEGGLLQAHKLVLTICSPYFRQIFQLNPHQHPIGK